MTIAICIIIQILFNIVVILALIMQQKQHSNQHRINEMNLKLHEQANTRLKKLVEILTQKQKTK